MGVCKKCGVLFNEIIGSYVCVNCGNDTIVYGAISCDKCNYSFNWVDIQN